MTLTPPRLPLPARDQRTLRIPPEAGTTSPALGFSDNHVAKAPCSSDLEPYAYLRYLFTELLKAETVEAIEALLPGTIKQDQISRC